MVQFNRFKDIAKVGKSFLVQMVGLAENSKEVTVEKTIDYNSCPADCPFKNFSIDKKEQICKTLCTYNQIVEKEKVTYLNENHFYNIKKEDRLEKNRLSKYQMLQLISYHFLGVDSHGRAKYISTKELAEKLNCTVRTIRENNKILEELGLIFVSSCGSDLFNVHIIGYEKYHLTKLEGGTGYVQMTKSFIEALFSMENVNAMRLAIRALLRYDREVEVEKGDVCFYSFKDIKSFTPSHINHKKIILELFDESKEVFNIQSHSDGLYIELNEKYNGKIQKDRIAQDYAKEITEVLAEEKLIVSPEDVSDLAQLSMEYGESDIVIESIRIYKKYINRDDAPEFIENFGGFIRTIIKRSLLNNPLKNVA